MGLGKKKALFPASGEVWQCRPERRSVTRVWVLGRAAPAGTTIRQTSRKNGLLGRSGTGASWSRENESMKKAEMGDLGIAGLGKETVAISAHRARLKSY